MNVSPFFKAGKRVVVLEYQVIDNGKNLFIGVRETGFQILRDAELFTDGIEKIGGTVE